MKTLIGYLVKRWKLRIFQASRTGLLESDYVSLEPVSHPDMEVPEMTVTHVEYLALLMIFEICGSR